MAKRGNRRIHPKINRASTSTTFTGGGAQQPPPFRPTAQGLQNNLPFMPATDQTGNAVITNLGAEPGQDYLYKLYLFVHEVEAAWSVTGDYGQGNFAKTFYPKNFHENEISIIGQCANQYEYDKLVTFVQHHHHTALSAQNEGDGGWVDFKLYPHTNPPFREPLKPGEYRRYIHRGMHYGLLLTDIEAGAERFKHFPLFRLTCTVVNDYIQPPYEVDGAIYNHLVRDYMQTFGHAFVPPVHNAATHKSETITTAIEVNPDTGDNLNVKGGSLK